MRMTFPLALAAAFALAAPGSLAAQGADTDASRAARYAEALSGAINHPTRKEDRARDAYRHPAETLAFFDVAPDMKVGEYAPGGGWYSRVLGHYLGGEGQLVGLFSNPAAGPFDEKAQAGLRSAAEAFPKYVSDQTGLAADRFSAMTLETIPDAQAGSFDRILIVRMMHNLMRRNIADSEVAALRKLLKDDGMIGIVQHRARADSPFAYSDGSKGYLREADVIKFMEINGFELVRKSEVNANAKDTADWPKGVWELPPTLATKRDELKPVGESDRMTLLFRKRP